MQTVEEMAKRIHWASCQHYAGLSYERWPCLTEEQKRWLYGRKWDEVDETTREHWRFVAQAILNSLGHG